MPLSNAERQRRYIARIKAPTTAFKLDKATAKHIAQSYSKAEVEAFIHLLLDAIEFQPQPVSNVTNAPLVTEPKSRPPLVTERPQRSKLDPPPQSSFRYAQPDFVNGYTINEDGEREYVARYYHKR